MSILSRRAFVTTFVVAPLLSSAFAHRVNATERCSGGWKVSGYYTASELEFSGSASDIEVDGHGYLFPEDFLRRVRTDGWGLTHHGWFLGWNKGWRRSDAPLNARGEPLAVGGAAVDPDLIPLGTRFRIPDLPTPWSGRTYAANDIGGGINGKRVDIYCGSGPDKRQVALQLTGSRHTVCIEKTAA